MIISVLFFAEAREIIGSSKKIFHINDTTNNRETDTTVTINNLLSTIINEYPKMKSLIPTSILSINLEYVNIHDENVLSTPIHENDEIAFITPISGG